MQRLLNRHPFGRLLAGGDVQKSKCGKADGYGDRMTRVW